MNKSDAEKFYRIRELAEEARRSEVVSDMAVCHFVIIEISNRMIGKSTAVEGHEIYQIRDLTRKARRSAAVSDKIKCHDSIIEIVDQVVDDMGDPLYSEAPESLDCLRTVKLIEAAV